MATPRIAVGLALAVLLSGIVAAPAMADGTPTVDPNCNATVSTPTLFDQESLTDTVPMTVLAPFECGGAFETNAWSFTLRSDSGASIVWKPGGISQIRNTTFTVQIPNLYPDRWTLTSNVAWIKVKSDPITILGTVHNTASVVRVGSTFTVTGSIDRLAKGGRIPWAKAPGLLLSQLTRGDGYPYRARDLPVSADGRYSYSGVSNDMLMLRLSTGRIQQSPYVEFATSNTLTVGAYAPPVASAPPTPPATTPPPAVTPPSPAGANPPPVVASPAPVVTTPAPPVVAPAPPAAPVVVAKHGTVLSVSDVHRTGKRLSMKARLIDQDRARSLSAVVEVQRWTSHGWRTVAVETTGRFTVKGGKGLYRLVYAGSRAYEASVSRAFLR